MKDSGALRIVELVCDTAIKGLRSQYLQADRASEQSVRGQALSMASNLRYLIIAQIGIGRWERQHTGDDKLPDLWDAILSRRDEIKGIGDLGLALWAAADAGRPEAGSFADDLSAGWPSLCDGCNAVELAWVVGGIVCFLQTVASSPKLADVLQDAHSRLVGLHSEQTRLFYRHSRRGLAHAMSRRIACFADQIYPVLALAHYGARFRHGESRRIAVAAADAVCRLQGPQGQWWWHYDVNRGTVAEEYPVFSVHQHGMAPMALLAVDEAAGTDHGKYIEAGLLWLTGRNELNLNMIQPEQGVVWRDIERREIGKVFRLVRAGLGLAGWDLAHRLAGKRWLGYAVNRECRPYELGWILYAWAPLVSQAGLVLNRSSNPQQGSPHIV